MNKKLKRINSLLENLLGLNLIGSAYGYNTGSVFPYTYQSLSGNTGQMDMSSFGINEPVLVDQNTGDKIDGVTGTSNRFLRFNSSPPSDFSPGGVHNINGFNRNFTPDNNMIEELKKAVSEGVGNYEEDNNDVVDLKSVVVTQEDLDNNKLDVFNIVVELNKEFSIEKCQLIIKYVNEVIEGLDTGDIKVSGTLDFDSSVESSDILKQEEDTDSGNTNTSGEDDNKSAEITDSDVDDDTYVNTNSKKENKYISVLRFKVLVSR